MRKSFVLPLIALASSAIVFAEPVHGPLVDSDAVAEAGRVEPSGKVTSAGQPGPEALEVFADSGYKTVIDLRGSSEDRGFDERGTVESLGMEYISFPVTGGDDINFDRAAELDRLIMEQEGPVLVHCGSGNRVGAMLALIESLEGASDGDALATGRKYGLTGLEETVRDRLEVGDGQ